MAYEKVAEAGFDYQLCTYENSKLTFRGPFRMPQAASVAVIGGSESYGKFIRDPFPKLLEYRLRRPVINLGCLHASPEAFLNDPVLEEVCQKMKVVVVQIMGAQNISNRYYTVHPRRNDRFVRVTDELVALYPDLDFTDIHFTRHLLQTLYQACPETFAHVVAGVRAAWTDRMSELLDKIEGQVVLLWISKSLPQGAEDPVHPDAYDPLFVSREMVEAVAGENCEVVECSATIDDLKEHTRDMVFSDLEAPAAAAQLSPKLHLGAAEALADPVLRALK